MTSSNGQGKDFFADDISQCILGQHVAKDSVSEVFDLSIFSEESVFKFRYISKANNFCKHCVIVCSKNKDDDTKRSSHFETDPRLLIVVSLLVLYLT